MSQDFLAKLQCSDCREINYQSTRNKKILKERLKFNKHCPHCKKHTLHKETK